MPGMTAEVPREVSIELGGGLKMRTVLLPLGDYRRIYNAQAKLTRRLEAMEERITEFEANGVPLAGSMQ